MKRIITFLLTLILLFSLVGCNTNAPTPEGTSNMESSPSAPSPEPTFFPSASVSDASETPEETSINLDPVETPSGYYDNGLAYYSVEEEPDLIYDTKQIINPYHCLIVPKSSTPNVVIEGAGDASAFNPDFLPVIRLQDYTFYSYMTEKYFCTERSPEEIEIIRNIISQKLVETNQFTGFDLTEDSGTFNENTMLYQKGTSILEISYNNGLTFSFLNSDIYNSIQEGVDGAAFIDKMKDQQYISGIIQYAGYQNPVCKRNINYSFGDFLSYTYYIYNETEDAAQNFFNQNFNYIAITTSRNITNRVEISLKELLIDENTSKNFEAISYEEAKQQLLQGDYFTLFAYEFKEEDILYADLVYIQQFNQKYYIPCYRFYVITYEEYQDPEEEIWKYYYVPAVKGLEIR